MFLTAIAFVALQQSGQSPSSSTVPAQVSTPTGNPVFPMGSRPEVHQLLHDIQDLLAKGDIAGAKRLGDNLPKAKFTLGWDESGLPNNLKASVEDLRDSEIKQWMRIPGVEIKVAPVGDVNISFTKILPPDAAGLPMESKLTFGAAPRLSAVIGLNRGNPAQDIIPEDASMEVGHAIGAFLGVTDDSLAGSCMYRSNLPALRPYGPSKGDLIVAGKNLAASDAVRALIDANKPIEIKDPEMGVTPVKVEMGSVRQGVKQPLDFVITNNGSAPLAYALVPDCGCFTRVPPGVIAAGQKTTVRTLVNTSEYIGDIHKLLVLYTNDPKVPVQEIPVNFKATPPCRLYRPEGDNIVLPIPNDTFDILLTIPDGSKVKPSQYEWSNPHDKVTMNPWSGNAPDVDMDEPSKPRHGYVFHIKLGGPPIQTRISGTLHVVTDDDLIPDFVTSVNIQKGILALPEEVYLGEMSTVSRGTFLVSRRGKPFKITSVETGAKCLKATVTPTMNGSEYRIDVIYDGTASPGDFAAQIKIKTDDPTQPLLRVTLRGSIT